MKKATKLLVSIVSFAVLIGCSSTPKEFAQNRYTLSDANVCRTNAEAQKRGDYQFAAEVQVELDRRRVSYDQCQSEMTKQGAGAAVAILGAVLLVAAASRSGSGGGGGQYTSPATDYDWAWDEFYNQSYQLVWACRGKQTGQFAMQDKCAYKPQNDFTWPSKSAL